MSGLSDFSLVDIFSTAYKEINDGILEISVPNDNKVIKSQKTGKNERRMSDMEQEEDGSMENPEPEADAPPEVDAPPEAESNVDYTHPEDRNEAPPENNHSDREENALENNLEEINNSLAEGDQNHHSPIHNVDNRNGGGDSGENGGATAGNVSTNNLEAEDEQYYQGSAEVDFSGAEWSLEPEGNFPIPPGCRMEGEGAEGEDSGLSVQHDSSAGVAGNHRTESSIHLEALQHAGAESLHETLRQAQNLDTEADGASSSANPECNGHNNYESHGLEDEAYLMNTEREPTESDQDFGLAMYSASSSEMDRTSNNNITSRVQESENAEGIVHPAAAADKTSGESTQGDEELRENQVIPEDELCVVASGESKSTVTQSYQPECDQSTMEGSKNESSQVSGEHMNDTQNDVASAHTAQTRPDVGQTSKRRQNVVLTSDQSQADHMASALCEQSDISTSASSDSNPSSCSSGQVNLGPEIKNQNKNPPNVNDQTVENNESLSDKHVSGNANPVNDEKSNNCDSDRNTRESAANETKPSTQNTNSHNHSNTNCNDTHNPSNVPTETIGDSVETVNHSTKHSDLKHKASVEQSDQVRNSRHDPVIPVDSEEELLSELDATLQSDDKNKEISAISKDKASVDDEEESDISCEQCLRNNLQCSLRKGATHHRKEGHHSNIPETKDLKRQMHQAKQLLLDRECEISRLKGDVEDYKERIDTLVQERDSCQNDLDCMKTQSSDDLYIPQIKELEYTIAQQQNEVRSYKDKLSSHDASAKRAIATLQGEMKLRIDQVTKLYEEATKEKDSMVVKYAQAEHKNLECQKRAERAESKLRDMERERDTFMVKMRAIKDHKTKVSAELEAKVGELSYVTKELDKHREMVSSADVRVKWAQNKLKAELDAHKDTKVQLEKTNIKLKEAREETQQIRQDCQAIIKTYQESEEVKSNSLDKELKQKETELLANLQEKNSFELAHVKTQRELENMRGELMDAVSRCRSLTDKLSTVEAEKDGMTGMMNKYTDIIQKQKKDIQELRDRIETLVQYRSDFMRAQDMIKNLDAEIADLKLNNKDLVTEMEACRKRETDKLELTEKLSRKNAMLQSENTTLSNKVLNLTGELQSIKVDNQSVDTKMKELTDSLAIEQKLRVEEVQSLNTRLAGKSKAVEDLTRKLDEEKDEIKTLKRKHTNNVKDLTRQLQQVRRKLESYEASTNGDKDTVSMGSRTSSNGSLNTIPAGDQPTTQVVQPSGGSLTQGTSNSVHKNHQPEIDYQVITEQVEVDKQTLIERIVKLQRAMARKNEKLEFMEDHISQLVDEIQKKNRIIQSYILKEETGTMTSNSREMAKAEISRKHSIMGSVYSSHSNDGTMTLDLSLEINRKLQAVLEDTLLKNMTLKESLDTLGQEIARLSQENRSLQLQMQGKGRLRGGNQTNR